MHGRIVARKPFKERRDHALGGDTRSSNICCAFGITFSGND
jgi:hypothetical protein